MAVCLLRSGSLMARSDSAAAKGIHSARRELVEIAKAELLFEPGHLRHRAFEPVAAQLLLFLGLELFAELIPSLFAEHLVEGGEEQGVLARGVRPVHAVEGAKLPGEATAI